MRKKLAASLIVAGAITLSFPVTAVGHGIGGRLDLPVPISFFLVGAAVVLVVSFIALAVLWPTPRFQDGPSYEQGVFTVPRRGLLPALGVLALLLVVAQLIPPLLGLDVDPTRPTIAPVLVWVVFWLVVPFAGALIGNWYTDINPWRTLGHVFRVGRFERLGNLDRVGIWPASVVFLAFTWLELVSPNSSSATTLGFAALAYTIFLLITMATTGRETGLAIFDAFTPYNRLISSISPLGRREDGRIVWRGWLRSLPVIPAWPGLAAFVVVAIGTVTFDGGSGTTWYRDTFGDFGSSMLGSTVLLVGAVLLVGLGYWVASWAAARLAESDQSASEVAVRFAHTLVPIALAYALAHYLTLIVFEGQQLFSAISDPFGLGWDIFGTADRKVDFFITATEPIWYTQVAIIIGGHILGVILAHDRALADFGKGAVRSQYAMLLLMVALTALGLLILAG